LLCLAVAIAAATGCERIRAFFNPPKPLPTQPAQQETKEEHVEELLDEVDKAEVSSESTVTAKVERRRVNGTVVDRGEGCGFGIRLDGDDGVLVPDDLDDELALPGTQLTFDYSDENSDDDCEGGETVRIDHVVKTGKVSLPNACDDSRRQFATLVSIVQGLDKSCRRDSDCVAFGQDPYDNCETVFFTKGSSFASHADRHGKLLRAIASECERSDAPCEGLGATEPVCESRLCTGK
jgi:hypothetical protein